jgi:hypothetical protein
MRPNILMPIMIFMTRYYHSSKIPRRSLSVSHFLLNLFPLSLFALVGLLMSSCEEGPTKIGIGLLPEGDFVNIKSTDTLSVWSYTMFDDSVRTDKPYYGYLGHINDPYFGTTTAEFVTQIRLKPAWDDLPFTIDSVRLYLRLLDVKGSAGVTHTLKLSEIAEQIYPDSAYYSSTPVPLTGYEITNIEIPVLKPDTINEIILKLPIEFGNYLTRDTSKLFYHSIKPDFRSYFKGLYFQMSSGPDPMLISLYLGQPGSSNKDHLSSQNSIVIYLHDADNLIKSYAFVLDANNINASFDRFLHDYSSATPGKKIEHINDGYRDTLTYLQSLNGVYTKIIFPGLETLKNDPSFDHIAVNKARLTVPVHFDGDIYKASQFPTNLRLRYKVKNKSKYDVPDYSIDDYNSFFDGTLDSTNNVYNFNIAAFVQGYFEDATDNVKPELEIFQAPTGIKNAIFKANASKSPVKFEFTYTTF